VTKPNRPKHLAEMTRAEVNEGLIDSTRAGNIVYSPNDYRNELARRDAQDAAERANAIAAQSARTASRLIWATIASAIAAAVSATAAVLALNHSDTSVSPSPLPITSFEVCTDD
jgi:hypothetical protein